MIKKQSKKDLYGLLTFNNYMSWCKIWEKNPYSKYTMEEFIFETKQYIMPIENEEEK